MDGRVPEGVSSAVTRLSSSAPSSMLMTVPASERASADGIPLPVSFVVTRSCQRVSAWVAASWRPGTRPTVSSAVTATGQPSLQSDRLRSSASSRAQAAVASAGSADEASPAASISPNSRAPWCIASMASSCLPPGKKW